MTRYVLSPAAQRSLKQIQEYSLENFGKTRTATYLKALRRSMRELAKTPGKGKARDEIKNGYHSHFEGSHTIYYRIQDEHIEIIDVLHQSMEPQNHL